MRIILNPMARHGADHRIRPAIERELQRRKLEYEIVETEGPGHAVELAAAAADAGVPRVVAAGGDGTVHEVVNGLMRSARSAATFGLIPIGTGNDFVKMMPGSGSVPDAVATLENGVEAPVDVGVARWDDRAEYFVNAMGTGIDVEVVRLMRRSAWLPGTAIYLIALMRALARYRPVQLRIVVDGVRADQPIMNLAVCNGPSIGGSFRVCPDARFDDGLLDLCVVREMPLYRNIQLVPHVLAGTHPGKHGVTMLRGSQVHLEIEAGGVMYFQLDGELRESASGALDISVAPGRLSVIRRPTVAMAGVS